jgi:rod shape-determining protein MreD
MAIFLAVPILGFMVILQSAIFSQVKLLHGTTDLVLLIVVAWAVQDKVTTAWHWGIIAGLLASLATAVPAYAIIPSYVIVTAAALYIRRIFYQRPLLAMITATVLATLVSQIVSIVVLVISGTPIPIIEAFYLITVPSVLLNLLLAVPVYALIGDLANWLYPETIEI